MPKTQGLINTIKVITDYFEAMEWTWKLKGGRVIVPREDDVEKVLDKCIEDLYDEPIGSTLFTGRLIVRKETNCHDVYMLVGTIPKEN